MVYLENAGIGYITPWARVPIVPAAVIFDLNVGSGVVRPGAEAGRRACQAADGVITDEGTVGAGTGATVGKWAGTEHRMKGGLGCAGVSRGDVLVCAVAVVNAVGDVLDESGDILAGARSRTGKWLADDDPLRTFRRGTPVLATNTTLVVLMTNAKLSKVEANRVAQRGHNGMARAIKPVHTSYDGDVVFVLSCGAVDANIDLVAEMGAEATAVAIRNGVKRAVSAGGVPGLAKT
jgi:L-aminopeptidase/D-esterase-like protein